MSRAAELAHSRPPSARSTSPTKGRWLPLLLQHSKTAELTAEEAEREKTRRWRCSRRPGRGAGRRPDHELPYDEFESIFGGASGCALERKRPTGRCAARLRLHRPPRHAPAQSSACRVHVECVRARARASAVRAPRPRAWIGSLSLHNCHATDSPSSCLSTRQGFFTETPGVQ